MWKQFCYIEDWGKKKCRLEMSPLRMYHQALPSPLVPLWMRNWIGYAPGKRERKRKLWLRRGYMLFSKPTENCAILGVGGKMIHLCSLGDKCIWKRASIMSSMVLQWLRTFFVRIPHLHFPSCFCHFSFCLFLFRRPLRPPLLLPSLKNDYHTSAREELLHSAHQRNKQCVGIMMNEFAHQTVNSICRQRSFE